MATKKPVATLPGRQTVPATAAVESEDTDGQSRRRQRTRALLVDAARHVFERSGFVDARISDIATAAGVAHGTFYTYFDSKEAIFREVVMLMQSDMAGASGTASGDDPWSRIEHSNRIYAESYMRNAALMATLEQVVTFNEDIRQMRREVRQLFSERNTRAIRRWQKAGLADPELDAHYAANALGAMVDRFMYVWLVIGEPFDKEKAVATLTRLWVRALGLEPPPTASRRKRAASVTAAVPALTTGPVKQSRTGRAAQKAATAPAPPAPAVAAPRAGTRARKAAPVAPAEAPPAAPTRSRPPKKAPAGEPAAARSPGRAKRPAKVAPAAARVAPAPAARRGRRPSGSA